MKPLPFVRFAVEVLGLTLSPAWRVLLAVAVDGVEPSELEGEERELARLLFGDVDEIPDDARRTLVWRLGRGSGKTTIAAALGLHVMLTASLASVGPGMTSAIVGLAPGKPTAKIFVAVGRELVRRVPALERLVCDDGDTSEGFSLRRPDGKRVTFAAVAASRGGTTLRGYDILALILDESEFLSSNADVASGDGYAINDRDLYNAAKPRLHGPAIFISTPWPVENLTAELFDKNHGKPTTCLAAIGASTTMRPDDERLARDVATALADDADGNAAREYLCQPGARGGSRLFDSASIDAAAVEGRPLAIYAEAGATIGCGGDLGLERDSSAIAVVGKVDEVYTLLEFDEVRPLKGAPLAPGYVIRERFAPVMQRHGVDAVSMDGHYRQSAAEHLEALNLEFARAPEGQQGKYDTYMHVRSLLRTGNLKLPAVPRLLAQLRAVTSTPLPGGGTKITSPRRMGQAHGDIVSALVLACWQAREGDASGGWFSLSPQEQAMAFANVGGRFDASCFTAERPAKPVPPLTITEDYFAGTIEACGNPPHFLRSERGMWSARGGEPARFNADATPAFRLAVTEYRNPRTPKAPTP